MDSHITNAADPALIRPDIKDALDAYAHYGHPLGDFLQAVVANLLVDAALHADPYNLMTLPAIAGYVYSHIPAESWGSRKVYACWLAWHAHRDGPEALAVRDALDEAWRDARSRR